MTDLVVNPFQERNLLGVLRPFATTSVLCRQMNNSLSVIALRTVPGSSVRISEVCFVDASEIIA